MPIDFSPERWDIVRENYTKWWNRELDRPIIKVDATKPDAKPWKPTINQANCADFSRTPEEIADSIAYDLERKVFLYDSYPYFNMDGFGPGVLAAFCNGILDNSSGRVWFHGAEECEISDLHVEYDPNNMWSVRIKNIYHAVNKRLNGQVVMGMVDMGGILDVVASLRGTENLLMDLYDEPDEVRRVCEETLEAWFAAYKDLNEVIQQKNPGYSDWEGIFSSIPSYVIQSDFSYMIGPDMFEKFALPELTEQCERLGNVIYHLDGKGELPHVDLLLGIQKLKAVQWVAGDGTPAGACWMDLYRRFRDAGKNYEIMGKGEDLIEIKNTLGKKGLYVKIWAGNAERDKAWIDPLVAELMK